MSKSKHKPGSQDTSGEMEDMTMQEMHDTPGMEDQFEEMKQQAEQWKDKYMRCMADFDNYRRQMALKQKDWTFMATEKLILSVCDVVDNFERAMAQLNDTMKEEPFIKGIIQIEKQLSSVLEKEGVEKIEAINQDFDPTVHEALAHIPSEMEEDKVVAIIQNGYKMKGKLLRAARVAVSNGEKPAMQENNNNNDKDGGNNV